MTRVKQTVYLMTEQQRDVLLNYLLNRPYREVAGAIQFLGKAPKTEINLEVPDEQSEDRVPQEESQAQIDAPEETKLELVETSA